jgi:predicted RNA-binding Zn-ribbon protein involved in translation (DUF1610 family)
MSGGSNDVGAEFACPNCGEQDADRLEVDEDETVKCHACGATYSIADSPKRNEQEMN